MKSRSLLVLVILATTAAISHPLLAAPLASRSADGHEQAAALLSRPQTLVPAKTTPLVRSPSIAAPSRDGQAKAAALLSRPHTGAQGEVTASRPAREWSPADGQAAAAALLSRSRTT